MASVFRTIQDMERYYYGGGITEQVVKVDAPVLSSTTGVLNQVYGAQVWSQINQEANVWGVLPKNPWDKSGWRVMTARAGSSADGAVAENGAIPDSTKPTFSEIAATLKTVAHTFNVSHHQHLLALSGDDAIGRIEELRQLFANKHREALNQQLLRDVDSTAGNRFESIDRVCSSLAEEALIDAGDSDIYGIDRSDTANSWADAYVDHNSGTDRKLSDTMLRTMLNTVQENGGKPVVWITGHDTMTSIMGIYDAQVRYSPLGQATFRVGVNGIQTEDGIGVGINVATLYGRPLILSKDVVKDTISRVYLLDTSDPEGFGKPRLGIDVAMPTQYFEAGMVTGDPFGIDKIANEGMFVTMGELKCRNFKAQGKIRDLK